MNGSIKWVILFVLAIAFASMIVGFIKGAIQQRRINKKAANHENKPKKKTARQPEVRKPRRLGNSPEEPEEKR